MRQPQALNACLALDGGSTQSTPVASRLPSGTPACGQEDQKPRCSSLAVLGGHQDGTAPLTADREALHAGGRPAAGSARRCRCVAYVGSRPMAKVAAPIMSSETTSIFLRPTLSPKWPKTTPPSGRATKPRA